ncbi:MAG: hypothetical protein Q9177_004071, partial [Variospora cf. flavescens]
MGRRPNQRVLEYFDRGARLENNSNRYEHTCKACGDHFPKGRIETLISHIERKCPCITRHDVVSEPSPAAISTSPTLHVHPYHDDALENSNSPTPKGKQLVLPVSSRRSGLEALVEAASRQLEHPRKATKESRNQSIDPDLEKDNPLSLFSGSHQDVGEAVDYNVAYSTAETDGSHAMSGSLLEYDTAQSVQPFAKVKRSQDPAMLSMVAASAGDLQVMMMMPHGIGNEQDQATTAVAQEAGSQQSMATATHSEDLDPAKSIEDSTGRQRLKPVPRPLMDTSSAVSGPDIGSSQQPCSSEKLLGRAQKVRGKFTDSRRQEVQKMRKKGACIRCRMLRKTCSGESPCKTCASVTSARVWKLDCVRTNIYKELDIFHPDINVGNDSSTPEPGYPEALASQLLTHRENNGPAQGDRYRIGVKYANSDASPMPFTIQLCKQQTVDGTEDPAIGQNANVRDATLLNDSTDQIAAKLLPYMRATISHPSYEEVDPLIGRTLRRVLNSMQENSDVLLAQTFDLWALTQVIISSSHDWHLVPDPSGIQKASEQGRQEEPDALVLEDPGDVFPTHPPPPPPPPTPLVPMIITSQLRATAQQRAFTISKIILIDLERRLERKERCRGFETFLVGILFLNCVERMCWAVRKANFANKDYDKDFPPRDPTHHDDHDRKSTHFAAFLSKLYQMRGILLHVRRRRQGGQQHNDDNDDDDDDGEILHAAANNNNNPTTTSLAFCRPPMPETWLAEVRLT